MQKQANTKKTTAASADKSGKSSAEKSGKSGKDDKLIVDESGHQEQLKAVGELMMKVDELKEEKSGLTASAS